MHPFHHFATALTIYQVKTTTRKVPTMHAPTSPDSWLACAHVLHHLPANPLSVSAALRHEAQFSPISAIIVISEILLLLLLLLVVVVSFNTGCKG